MGEAGSDTGGLTREFFRLFARAMASHYLEETGCFKHNAVALQVNLWTKAFPIVYLSVHTCR